MSRFRPELLPLPRIFYQSEIASLTRPNRKGWALGNCPFHKSKSRRSFGANLDSGAFFCHGCHAKGDIISFVMQRDGLDFKNACKSFGAWESDDERKCVIKERRGPVIPYLLFEFEVEGIQYHIEIKDEPKTELQQLRRFVSEAADRLREIHNGDAEKFEGEEEAQWAILAYTWELIQIEVSADVR